MLLDAALAPTSLSQIPALARAAESIGFSAVWTTETQHDPFLPLALAAEHTARLHFGTAVAIGFARSPMTLAHTAWDLAAQSGGRFILGLGTQVKAHVERRFGMPWPESPVGKLRELVLALRAIWNGWQTDERLNFRGEYFKLTLMSPFFNPGPIEHPRIPVFIAGVNTGLARLAGEVCDGFHVHPYHSPAYLREVLRPAIAAGAVKAGRAPSEIQVAGSVFVVASDASQEREFVRSQIAFYASTPSYRSVLAHHGWERAGEELSALAARGQWEAMPALITDEMLHTFAVAAPSQTPFRGLAALAAPLKERYAGLLDRITLYRPFAPGEDDAGWRALAAEMQRG